MKTVFTNDMVCHVWAQQTQDNGRNSNRSIFFDGGTIYSYGKHFPMASFVFNDKGESCILINSKSYSVTTSQHQNSVIHSIDMVAQPVFYVPGTSNTIFGDMLKDHDCNIADFQSRITGTIKRALKARATNSQYSGYNSAYHNMMVAFKDIKRIIRGATEYCRFFGLEFSYDFAQHKADLCKAIKHKKKLAIKAIKDAPKKEVNRLKRIESRRRAYIKGMRDKIKEWMKAKPSEYNYNYRLMQFNGDSVYQHLPCLLRYNKNKSRIETSQGAECDIKFVKLAWKKIQECKQNKTTWETNGHSIPLGHFKLDRVNPDGSIKAGCHTIKYGPIKFIARQLGLV